jgi:hypothetical protein
MARFTRRSVVWIERGRPKCTHRFPAGDRCNGLELAHIHVDPTAVGFHEYEGRRA